MKKTILAIALLSASFIAYGEPNAEKKTEPAVKKANTCDCIAFINSDKLMMTCKAYKSYELGRIEFAKSVDKYMGTLQEELAQKERSIAQAYKQNKGNLNDKDALMKFNRLRDLFQKKTDHLNRIIEKKNMAASAIIRKAIGESLNKIYQAGPWRHVMELRAAIMVDPKTDLTDRVMEGLNKDLTSLSVKFDPIEKVFPDAPDVFKRLEAIKAKAMANKKATKTSPKTKSKATKPKAKTTPKKG
jgi:Skp family chaperone for outer membrane proteins